MLDFYFEKTRTTVTEDWPESFTLEDLAQALGIPQVRFRIYYSEDNLTLRLFVFRPRCTWDEQKIMLDLGFVPADDLAGLLPMLDSFQYTGHNVMPRFTK
jgi:hypothetical protein